MTGLAERTEDKDDGRMKGRVARVLTGSSGAFVMTVTGVSRGLICGRTSDGNLPVFVSRERAEQVFIAPGSPSPVATRGQLPACFTELVTMMELADPWPAETIIRVVSASGSVALIRAPRISEGLITGTSLTDGWSFEAHPRSVAAIEIRPGRRA